MDTGTVAARDCVQMEQLKQEDQCPKCKEGHLEHHSHTYSVAFSPYVPDCDWLECDSCGFKTEPE